MADWGEIDCAGDYTAGNTYLQAIDLVFGVTEGLLT